MSSKAAVLYWIISHPLLAGWAQTGRWTISTYRSTVDLFHNGLVTDSVGVPNALLEAVNVYIDGSGEIRKRGGKSTNASNNLPVASLLTDHMYHPGLKVNPTTSHRLVSLSDGGTYKLYSRSAYGTDSAFTQLGNRVNAAGSTVWSYQFFSLYTFGDEIISNSPNGTIAPIRWAGSTKSNYSTGTCAATNGSTTVTCSAANWTSTNVEAGMYIRMEIGSIGDRYFRIARRVDDSTLTLDQAVDEEVTAGTSYSITSVGKISSPSGIFGSSYPNGTLTAGHKGRIFVANPTESSVAYPLRIRWSALENESSGKFKGSDYWHSGGVLDLPDVGKITAMISFSDQLIIFTQNKTYALLGDVATNGDDLGASVVKLADFGAYWEKSVVDSSIGLVVANEQGVFVYDGSSFNSLTDGKISREWKSNVAGYICTVSNLGTRLVFQSKNTFSNNVIYVYDIRWDCWVKQQTGVYSGSATPNETFGRIFNVIDPNYGLSDGQYTFGTLNCESETNWEDDLTTTNKNELSSTVSPRFKVTTHPIAIGGDGNINGRAQVIHVNGYITDAASDNPTMDVKLIAGNKGTDSGAESDVTVGSISEGTVDTENRKRVINSPISSHVRINIEQANAASDARIYGVTVDSSKVGRVRS